MSRITMKAARVMANLTQEQLASKLGVTAPTVARWENSVTVPSIIEAYAISEACGVLITDICWC